MKRNQSHKYFCRILIILLLLFFQFYSVIGQKIPSWKQSFKKCWIYSSDKLLAIKSASDNDLIFVSSLADKIQAINSLNGKTLWASSVGGKIIGEIIANTDNVIVLNEFSPNNNGLSSNTQNDNLKRSLISLNSDSGVTNWKKELDSIGKILLYNYERFVVIVENRGIVSLINTQDGKTLHVFDVKEEITAIHSYNKYLVLGTFEKKIRFFSVVEGKLTREIFIEEIPNKILISDNENVIWADKKGLLRSINATNKKTNWKKRFGGQISSITDTSNGILVSSHDNFIYLLNIISGKVKWRKRLGGRITEEPLIANNIVVAVVYGERTSAILDSETGEILNYIVLSDANQFVGNPVIKNDLLVFPTLKGLFAFSNSLCLENKKTGE